MKHTTISTLLLTAWLGVGILHAEPDAGARYRWSGQKNASPSHGLILSERKDGNWVINTAPGGMLGMVLPSKQPVPGGPFPMMSAAPPDQPGSSQIELRIDPKVGVVHFAGLAFTKPCVVGLLPDGTVYCNKPGLAVTDRKRKTWVSQNVALSGTKVAAFLPK